MTYAKGAKTEGGHKRGHSNMTHWQYTEIIKAESKKYRRVQDKEACRDADH